MHSRGGRMGETRVGREGGAAGLAAMALLLASLPMAPPWPPADAPADAVVAYFADHHAGFLRQAWLATGGAVLLVPFAAAVAAKMHARERTVAGATVFGAMLLFSASFGV